MPIPNNAKFVKFQRGSAAAYAALAQKDLDTLYFIYDANDPTAGGLLYLGNTLIGGTGSIVGSSTLAGLSDVDLTGLADSALLCYDAAASKWVLEQPSELLSGGISVAVGTLGENETIAQAQSRLGGASPNEGDIVIINSESYIYDGSQWQSLKSNDLTTKVGLLETQVGSLQSTVSTLSTDIGTLQTQMSSVDGKIAQAVSNANHLTYRVVNDLTDIDTAITNNPADINRTVFLVPNNSDNANNVYDEYMVVGDQNKTKERLGGFGNVDLSNYVTSSTFNTTVGSLQSSIAGIQSSLNDYVLTSHFNTVVGDITQLSSNTIVDELVGIETDISDLYERLQWTEINNNNNNG